MIKKTAAATGHRAPSKPVVGWRERVDLPQLNVFGLKAKVDTGAKTSSLHVAAVSASPVVGDTARLRLRISYTAQDGVERTVSCSAHSCGVRRVKSSTGHVENRHVIVTNVRLGDVEYPIELTLSDRSDMNFPMLLGRTALRRRFLVDCARSFVQSRSRNACKTRKNNTEGHDE